MYLNDMTLICINSTYDDMLSNVKWMVRMCKIILILKFEQGNLAKLGDGLNESPTVMVGEAAKKNVKYRGIIKPLYVPHRGLEKDVE